jgi:lysozyme family protein
MLNPISPELDKALNEFVADKPPSIMRETAMTFVSYKMGTDLQFEKCLPFTLRQEGGFSNDKNDRGGRTMEGITQREYDANCRAWGYPLADVKLIPNDQLYTIYYSRYWFPNSASLCPGLNLSFFDQCVNEGPREAVILLQRSMGINGDGIWGAKTNDAVKFANKTPRAIITNYSNHRANFYRGIVASRPSQAGFLSDWLRRTSEIEAQSLAMI